MTSPTVFDGTEVTEDWLTGEALSVRAGRLRCECLATIEWEDLARGYCSCTRPLTVVIGEPNFGAGMQRRTMAEPL